MLLILVIIIVNPVFQRVFAERAGCWQSCHHDVNYMPHQPEDAALSGPLSKQLDLSGGFTKYLKESRTEIEIDGKDGKKRGGWDKLKDEAELQALMENGSATPPTPGLPSTPVSIRLTVITLTSWKLPGAGRPSMPIWRRRTVAVVASSVGLVSSRRQRPSAGPPYAWIRMMPWPTPT